MAAYDSSDVHAPRVNRYIYKEFPRMLHAPDGRTKVVNTAEEKEAAMKKGWELQPRVILEAEDPDPIDVEKKSKKN
jgi:hypothetical protein